MRDKVGGKITRVVSGKGYGWIEAEDGEQYFFHHSSLMDNMNISDLVPGDEVRFKPSQTTKGKRALSVEVL